MSIRAYRIIEIKAEKKPSFNLWNDEKLMGFLDEKGYLDGLNKNGGGIIEIPVVILQEALTTNDIVNDIDVIKQLEKGIKIASQKKDIFNREYITYYCY